MKYRYIPKKKPYSYWMLLEIIGDYLPSNLAIHLGAPRKLCFPRPDRPRFWSRSLHLRNQRHQSSHVCGAPGPPGCRSHVKAVPEIRNSTSGWRFMGKSWKIYQMSILDWWESTLSILISSHPQLLLEPQQAPRTAKKTRIVEGQVRFVALVMINIQLEGC
jgi:hypothetical protein